MELTVVCILQLQKLDVDAHRVRLSPVFGRRRGGDLPYTRATTQIGENRLSLRHRGVF